MHPLPPRPYSFAGARVVARRRGGHEGGHAMNVLTRRTLAALAAMLQPVFALAQAPQPAGCDFASGWHMAAGWGGWWIFPLLMVLGFFACAMFMLYGRRPIGPGSHADSALRILDERFAKGELQQ